MVKVTGPCLFLCLVGGRLVFSCPLRQAEASQARQLFTRYLFLFLLILTSTTRRLPCISAFLLVSISAFLRNITSAKMSVDLAAIAQLLNATLDPRQSKQGMIVFLSLSPSAPTNDTPSQPSKQ